MKSKLKDVLRWVALAPTAIVGSLVATALCPIFILFSIKLLTGKTVGELIQSDLLINISGAIGGFIGGYVLVAIAYYITPKNRESIAKVSTAIAIMVLLYIGWGVTDAFVYRDFNGVPHDVVFFITVIVMVGNKNAWWGNGSIQVNNN